MNSLPQESHRIEFTATAGEYFRLWVVNLLLTIVTLGVYSAWAKVRKKRFFYERTLLDGESFEYRGQPLAILKGRILALVVVGIVYGVSNFAVDFLWIVLIAAVFVVPWLVVRSFAFNAHNSVYRNIRMKFGGSYKSCLKLFLGYGLLTILTLGLGYFYLKTRLTEFLVRNHAYGATPFEVPDLKKSFFSIYGKLIGLGLIAGFIVSTVSVATFTMADVDSWAGIALNVFVYTVYLGLFAYIRANIINATWNHARLGGLRFESTLRVGSLFVLYAVNIVAIIATLGLATPWAVVRTMRYRADNLTVLATGGLDSFPAGEGGSASAAGEEIAEMMDFDFSI